MSPAEGDRDTQRILIVDDEPAVREALQRSLAFEGYDTEVAVDGADALEKATAYQPDLVVLDIQMPRMDGLTAARRMRGAGTTTPILMLTARDTVGDRVTGLDAGADDYLVKPFELDELFARVRALLRRSSYAAAAAAGAGPEDDSLTFADLRMDLATREVTRNGRQVELNPHGVHPPGDVPRASAPGPHPRADPQGRLGLRLRAVLQLPRRVRDVPPPQDGGGGEPRLVHTVRGVGYVLRQGGAE